LSRLILVPAALLLTLGIEGLYHAFRGREIVAVDCAEVAQARAGSHRWLIRGCEIDYGAAAYREAGGEIREIFLPARPRGRTIPAPIVLATREPSALAAFRPVASVDSVTPQQSVAVVEKVAGLLQVTRSIDGLVRSGMVEQLRTRRILSGLTRSVAPDAVIVDVRASPDFTRPLLILFAGIVLAALPLVSRSATSTAAPSVKAQDSPLPAMPGASPATVPTAVPKLPKLLLLKLDVTATPECVEKAPPLGPRRELIQILSSIISDLDVSHTGHVLTRPDGSLTLDLGPQDPVQTVVVDARGEAGVALVKELLLMTGWRAFVPKTGLFVTVNDLDTIAALASGIQVGSREVRKLGSS
jgi:hypothetical protein